MMNDLTASELSNLWISYESNTMAYFVTMDFLTKAEDPGIRDMLEFALQLARKQVDGTEQFLKKDGHPLPEPFTERDVDINGPKRFSDNYVLLLKYKLASDALPVYGLAMATARNADVRAFLKRSVHETADLIDLCSALLIEKGLHQPLIYIPRQEKTEKIHSQSFLGKWFGKDRPLSAPEVVELVVNYQSIEIHREALRSFALTEVKEIRNHFKRGVEICDKHLNLIQNMLEKYELPQLPTWESEVPTEGISAPFSDRLMLFKTALMNGIAATQYASSTSASLRKDIGIDFERLRAEFLLYAEDTINIMIEREMLDQPALVKQD